MASDLVVATGNRMGDASSPPPRSPPCRDDPENTPPSPSALGDTEIHEDIQMAGVPKQPPTSHGMGGHGTDGNGQERDPPGMINFSSTGMEHST